MTAAAFRHHDTGNVKCPVLTAQAVAVGDLVGLSSGNVVRAEDTAWNSTLAATQADFAKLFMGASAQAKTAAVARVPGNGSDNVIRVATKDVVEYDTASASYKVGDLVGPAKQSGNALESQKVAAVAYERLAIGRVFEATTSATRVKVQLMSALKPEARQDNTGNTDVATIAALTDSSGGATADGTIGAVAAPSAITDSSGGSASTTLAANTSPTAVTDSSGGSTADTTLAAVTLPTLAGWNGSTDPSAAEATQIINCTTALKNAVSKLAVVANADAASAIANKNAISSLAARQAENRTALVALTDAVKELSTKVNEVIAALKTANIVA